MALGPGVQLVTLVVGGATDSWTQSTLNILIVSGWAMLPLVAFSALSIKTVGLKYGAMPNADEAPEPTLGGGGARRNRKLNDQWLDETVCFGLKRRFVVPASAQAFFIGTLLANGMTVRYFSLYYTQIMKFDPIQLCALNVVARLWIAGFVQVIKPLLPRIGRTPLCLIFHLGSALFLVGVYGGGFFTPSVWVSCICYMMRFAFLHARDPMLYSMTMDCVPESQRSRWAALNSLRTLSFSGSALIGGFLADKYGYDMSFHVTVISLLACTVFFVPCLVWFPRSEGSNVEIRDKPADPNTPGLARFSPTERGQQ